MRPLPLIRASIMIGVAAFARREGANESRLWKDAGLPGPPTGAPERLVPLPAALRLFEIAALALRQDDFGARCARHVGLEVLGPFGRAMLRAGTLHRAMQVAVDRVDDHNSGAQYWVIPASAFVRFHRRFRVDGTAFRQADLFTLALMMHLVQRFTSDRAWRPDHVELQSTGTSAASVRQALELPASCRVQDGRPATGIRVPRALVARHMTDPPVNGAGLDFWPGRPVPDDFESSVELVVESLLTSKRPLLAATAKAAGVQTRTLQRKLSKSGRAFRELVDRVRSRKAAELLDDELLRIRDVAFALGYADAAHFSRAFRRWTSMTPAEYCRLRRTTDGRTGRQAGRDRPLAGVDDVHEAGDGP